MADNNLCPCCHTPEDSTHVIRCNASDFSSFWDEGIVTLTNHLEANRCCPSLCAAIVSRLNAWRQAIPFTDYPYWSPALRDLIHSQDTLGWKNLMEGIPSTAWLPYIYTSIRRCAIDLGRKEDRRGKREEKSEREKIIQYGAVEDPWFETESSDDESRTYLEEGLKKLPEKFASVITLKIWGELTFAEIGKKLDISQNNVMLLKHKVLQ